MSYKLLIADRTYSSWSLRGWLAFAAFDIPVDVTLTKLYTSQFELDVAAFGGGGLVPVMTFGEGAARVSVWDSLAMAETLAEQNPDKHLWPKSPAQRALARAITAEMHSGFADLRNECQMNLRNRMIGYAPSEPVKKNLTRIETLWEQAWASSQSDGWLFGDYSIADAFFAPVAARIHCFGLPVSNRARAYVDLHLAHLPFRQWRARGLAENRVIEIYEDDLPREAWATNTLKAAAITDATPINTACPFSGKPVQDNSLAEVGGTVLGFCNPFCRDKFVADPAAWPKAMALL